MKKRVFIGIFASPKLKRKIFDFRHKFNDLPVRWMPDENLHLTLIPPVELDDNEMVEMIEKLKSIEDKFGPIEIEFEKVSFGPNLRRPRLIWIEGKPNQKLIKLKNRITQIFGLRKDGRPYFTHLTIARFKPNDYSNFSIKNLDEKVDWTDKAESISIIQSECLEAGARYTVLERIGL